MTIMITYTHYDSALTTENNFVAGVRQFATAPAGGAGAGLGDVVTFQLHPAHACCHGDMEPDLLLHLRLQ